MQCTGNREENHEGNKIKIKILSRWVYHIGWLTPHCIGMEYCYWYKSLILNYFRWYTDWRFIFSDFNWNIFLTIVSFIVFFSFCLFFFLLAYCYGYSPNFCTYWWVVWTTIFLKMWLCWSVAVDNWGAFSTLFTNVISILGLPVALFLALIFFQLGCKSFSNSFSTSNFSR